MFRNTEGDVAQVTGLIAGITLAYHRLTLTAAALHGGEGITAGIRSVLLQINDTGPQTISGLASQRSVSRQFMQRFVRQMMEEGWLEASPNPAHRRSSLVALTRKGETAALRIRAVEAPLLAELAVQLGRDELDHAEAVLQRLCVVLGEALKGSEVAGD